MKWMLTHKLGLLAMGMAWASLPAAGQCTLQWDTGFATAGAFSPEDPYSNVFASVVYDDGSGPALYVAGVFTGLNGVACQSIVKFDGTRWTGVGGGLLSYAEAPYYNTIAPGTVRSLAVWDPDGAGAQHAVLVAGGDFYYAVQSDGALIPATSVAMWDGTAWSTLPDTLGPGDAFTDPGVRSVAVFNGDLYIGGDFTTALTGDLAVWDRTLVAWNMVGGHGPAGSGGWVETMTVHNDGAGDQLYVGGRLPSGISTIANSQGIARFNGAVWSPVGATPIGIKTGDGLGMISFDADGSGGSPAALFYNSGNSMFKFAGGAWTSVPFTSPFGVTMAGRGLAVRHEGSTDRLYLSGLMTPGGSNPTFNPLYRYDGTTFQPVGEELFQNGFDSNHCSTLTAFNLGAGDKLFLGGQFEGTAAVQSGGNLVWNGASYESPIPGANLGLDLDCSDGVVAGGGGVVPMVTALMAFDEDGAGPGAKKLFVGGLFERAGGLSSPNCARLDNTGWTAGPALPSQVISQFATMDVAGVPTIFASTDAGLFQYHAGLTAWQSVPGIVGGLDVVRVDFGSGPRIYCGGKLWDGATAVSVGTPAEGVNAWSHAVTLVEGGQTYLVISGTDFGIGTIVRYDGTTLTNLNYPAHLQTLSGPRPFVVNGTLYVYNTWGDIAATPYPAITSDFYKWNGISWEFVLETPPAVSFGWDSAIGVRDFGTGAKMYFNFSPAGGIATWAGPVYAFDPTTNPELPPVFVPAPELGIMTWGGIRVMESFPEYGDDSLFFGGAFVGIGGTNFMGADAVAAGAIARRFCPAPPCPADYNHSGTVTVQDIFDFLAGYFAGCP